MKELEDDRRYSFVFGNVCDGDLINYILDYYQPSSVVHFAAETHVDRSITGPAAFIQTNIVGTFTLLEALRKYWLSFNSVFSTFRMVHVSTDEVYGSLSFTDLPFSETTPYAPNSPYSASKAAADHLVRSYFHTYGFPAIITNCSKNYGPFQFEEKLIPHMINCAITGKKLPVYGNGKNVRDWLYVEDHCSALEAVLEKGVVGEKYNIGGNCEMNNVELVHCICSILDKLKPTIFKYKDQIEFVTDRAGHDLRYAIDSTKIQNELGWKPQQSFDSGLEKTIEWYLKQWPSVV